MKQVDLKLANAIRYNELPYNDSKGNTDVVNVFGSSTAFVVRLHGNPIARFDLSENAYPVHVLISTAGWTTVTTKARINAVLDGLGIDARVRIKNYTMIAEGMHVDSGHVKMVDRIGYGLNE